MTSEQPPTATNLPLTNGESTTPPRATPRSRVNLPTVLFFGPAMLAILFQLATRLGGTTEAASTAVDSTNQDLATSANERTASGCSGPLFSRRRAEPAPPAAGCSAPFTKSSPAANAANPAPKETPPGGWGRASAPPLDEPSDRQLAPQRPASSAEPASHKADELAAIASPEQEAAALIEGYYRDLNAGTLDASRYFAPHIERYISMTGTSPQAINQYIHGLFKKQFTNPNFEYEAGSLSREPDGTLVFAERSSYYFVAKKRQVSRRYKVRIRVQGGKLVFFQQFERLPGTP